MNVGFSFPRNMPPIPLQWHHAPEDCGIEPPQPVPSLQPQSGEPLSQLVPWAWGESCSCSHLWPDALQLVYQRKVTGFEGGKGNLLPRLFKFIDKMGLLQLSHSWLHLGKWKYKTNLSWSCIFTFSNGHWDPWHLLLWELYLWTDCSQKWKRRAPRPGAAENPQEVAAAKLKTDMHMNILV